MLGCDSPRKALLTAVKEAVDNSLAAGEEAGILPEIGVEIHATEHENRFRMAVEDNGPGVPEAYRERVFGLFERLSTDRQGTGVGLALVRRVAELNGGSANVEDSPLGGARFRVEFGERIREARPPSENAPHAGQHPHGQVSAG